MGSGIDVHGTRRTVLAVFPLMAGVPGARTLFKLNAQDVLIVISFPRYVQDSITIASKARERGAQIVVVANRLNIH